MYGGIHYMKTWMLRSSYSSTAIHNMPRSALRPSGGGTVGTPVFSAKIEMHLHEPGCNRPLLFHFFILSGLRIGIRDDVACGQIF